MSFDDDLTLEEIEEIERLCYNIHGICEVCYRERDDCAIFRDKLICKECIDKIRLNDGSVAYI